MVFKSCRAGNSGPLTPDAKRARQAKFDAQIAEHADFIVEKIMRRKQAGSMVREMLADYIRDEILPMGARR